MSEYTFQNYNDESDSEAIPRASIWVSGDSGSLRIDIDPDGDLAIYVAGEQGTPIEGVTYVTTINHEDFKKAATIIHTSHHTLFGYRP